MSGADYKNAKPATTVNFDALLNFAESEFTDEINGNRQSALPFMDSRIPIMLQKLRNRIGRIRISPAPGAIVRFRPGSRHDITGGRLSDAIDVMPLDATLAELYAAAQELPEVGGVGLYPDWEPMPGAHIDLRPRKADGSLYTWSGFKLADGRQVYRGIDEALA